MPCWDTARLRRTFEPPPPRPISLPENDFVITRADFMDLYAYGTEIRISLSDEDEISLYDIGFGNDASQGSWTVPDLDYFTLVWTVVDPALTPYAYLYPGSTHALVSDDDPEFDGVRYQYYTFGEDLIEFGGYVEVPTQGDVYDDRFEATLAPMPLDQDMQTYEEGAVFPEDDGQPYPGFVRGGAFGFGGLTRPDGSTVQAGTFYDELVAFELDGSGEEYDWELYYSVFGLDGSWLYFEVADPPGHEDGEDIPLEGEVWVEGFEYWEIVPPSSVSNEQGPAGAAPWSVFPNPTTDLIRFSEPLTATVFDMMGRAVRQANRAREVDMRGLAPGPYVVRSESGHSRRVTLRR